MEIWVLKVVKLVKFKKVIIIKGIGDMLFIKGVEEEGEEYEGYGYEGYYYEFDLYVWLFLECVIFVVENICNKFVKVYLKDVVLFNKNVDVYIVKLKEFDKEYKNGLLNVK